MDNDKIKNWVMIGLLVSILVILVAQPMVTTEFNTTAWTTSNKDWEISESMVAGEFVESVVIGRNRTSPYLDGDRLLYLQHQPNPPYNLDVCFLNLTTYEVTNISDNPSFDTKQMIYKDKIAYNTLNSTTHYNLTNVYDLTTENTTTYNNDTPGSKTLWYDPLIVNDEFMVFYNWTTGWNGLWAYNYIENYTYWIYNSSVMVSSDVDAYGDCVYWFGWGENGTILAEPNIYVHDFSTNTTEELLNTTDGYIDQAWDLAVWGDKIVYLDYYGDADIYTIYVYNITTNRRYALNPGWNGAWLPEICGNTLVCCEVDDVSPSIEQIALVNLNFEPGSETYTAITNDSFMKDELVISDKYVAWSQIGLDTLFPLHAYATRSETADNDIIIYSYETYTETPTGQLATTYNLNWIYIVIILIVVIVGMFIYRLNDRTDWRYTR